MPYIKKLVNSNACIEEKSVNDICLYVGFFITIVVYDI